MPELSIEQINPTVTKIAKVCGDRLEGFRESVRTKTRKVVDYELLLFMENGGSCSIDNRKYNISADSIRVHKPGQTVYSYKYGGIYIIHFSIGNNTCARLDELPDFINDVDTERAGRLYDEMLRYYVRDDEHGRLMLKSRLSEFICLVFDSARNDRTELSAASLQCIKTARRFIKQNYSKRIQLSDIAAQTCLHPNYLHRMFTSATGETPFHYLQRVRIEQAKRCLLESDSSIERIAALCGYDSSAYFIKVFRQITAQTPNTYRRNNIMDTE